MNRKILLGMMMIGLVAALAGAGMYAYFNDTETVGENVITAGTLDLEVSGDPVTITVSDIAPGWEGGYRWTLKNVGSISGKVSVEFSAITNLDNVQTEPELIAEAQPWHVIRSTLGDPDNGELGEYLSTTGGYYYPGWNEFITARNTGPPNSYGIQGLNSLGGNTYDTGVTLGAGEEMGFGLVLVLREDLRAWDGFAQHDIDDNVIQGDSVEFDIIFHLAQA